MEEFLIKKFQYDLKVINYHNEFLEKYRFLKPKENFLIVYKFLINSLNNVKEIDPEILDSLGEKMYEDITSLYKFYEMWKKRKNNYHKYFLEYLYSLPELKEMYDSSAKMKEKMNALNALIKKTDAILKKKLSESDFKRIKKQNVDAIYEYSLIKDEYFAVMEKIKDSETKKEKVFRMHFEEFSDKIIKNLENILNTKIFYFTKYYSLRLQTSYLIKKFALHSGIKLSLNSITDYFFKNHSDKNIEKIKEIIKGVE